MIDITESLEENVRLESAILEEELETDLDKKPDDKKEKKESILSMLGRSLMYQHWGYPF